MNECFGQPGDVAPTVGREDAFEVSRGGELYQPPVLRAGTEEQAAPKNRFDSGKLVDGDSLWLARGKCEQGSGEPS